MLNKIENEKKILLKESLDVLITRPRSNTCPLLQSTIQSKKLKLGSKVIILGTDNVEHRVPQYVGVEGLIIDVPVHPATWYKVKFIDGQIITFRPSALKLLSDSDISNHDPNDHNDNNNNNEYNNNNNNNNNTIESLQTTTKPNLPPKHSQHSTKSKVISHNQSKNLLSNINPDLWASCKVKILSGKYNGQIALVKYSGNGWVQLDTQLGEVAKRATELELLEIRQIPNFPKPTESLTISIPVNNTSSNIRRRSNSESLVISPTSRTSIINTSPNSSNTPNTSSTSTISNSTPPNISNSNEFQSKSQLKIKPFSGNNNAGNNVKNNNKNNHNQKQDHHQHHLRQSNHNNYNQQQQQLQHQQPQQKIQKQQHRDSISQSYPSDIDDKDLHTVLVDPKIRNLQYDYFKKYVEKEVAKVKNRPNIKYWTNQIKSTMIDEEHERNISRVINENYCNCCQMEKWPSSIICWNELCSSSPIYWKLPGAAGTPIIPETRYKNMENVFKDELEKFTFSSIQSNNQENNNNKLNDIEPLEKKRKIRQFDNTTLPSTSTTSSSTSTTTTTTTTMLVNYDENERIACQILRSLSSLSPNQCFPNIVTEYINNSPILQVYTPSVSPSLTPSPIKTKSLMLPSPSKNTQKNERSDSGATDTEDGIRIDTIRQPLILKVKNNLNNNHNNNNNNNNNNNLKNNSLFVVSESALPSSSSASLSSTSLSSTTTTSSPNYKLVPNIHLNKNKEIQIPSQSKLIQNNHHHNNNNNNNNNLKISVHGLKSTPIQQPSSTTTTTTTTTTTITTKGIASFESSNLSQQNQLKITKKVKSPFSPTTKRGLFLAQGKPPTEEEFVKFLSEHHFPSQQISSSASFSLSSNLQHREPQPQEHLRDNQKIQKNGLETLPLSVLTSRVDSSSQRNMTEFTNVANGPPLLNSTYNTNISQSIYPQHNNNKINK